MNWSNLQLLPAAFFLLLFITTMVSTRDYLITLSQYIYFNYLYIDIIRA